MSLTPALHPAEPLRKQPTRTFLNPRSTHQLVWKKRREQCLSWLIRGLRICPTRDEHAFGIITYHKVAPIRTTDRALLNVTPRRFRQQLMGLVQLGYEPWPLRRVLEYEEAGEPVPREAFVVVFDDGFESVYRHALPVLNQLQIPATVFLATAYLDSEQPFPFDTCTNIKAKTMAADEWRPLKIRQCHDMLDSGLIEFGSHSHTHQDFRQRPLDFEKDLRISVQTLKREFGVIRPTFSFPYGFADLEAVAAAKRTDVRCGLTTDSRLVLASSDPFTWGRFGAVEFDNAHSLAAKLDGWYCRVREAVSWVLDAGRRFRFSTGERSIAR